MARTQARIFTSIWHDPDFLALTGGAQRLYMLALSQDNLTFCGVLHYTAKRWAKLAKDATVAGIRRDLAELVTHRFVIVDEATEEVWIRSFIRHDGILKSPNLILAMARDVDAVHSPAIRDAIFAAIHTEFPEGFREHITEAFPKGFAKGFPEGFCKELEKRFPKPLPEGFHTHACAGAASVLLPPSSSSGPFADDGERVLDEDETIEAALGVLAERALRTRPSGLRPVGDRASWLRRTVDDRRGQHGERARAILVEEGPLSAEDLAERLEPSGSGPGSGSGGESPDDVAARAAAELRRRQSLPPCPDCDGTGWVDADPAKGKCGCGRLMSPTERLQAVSR